MEGGGGGEKRKRFPSFPSPSPVIPIFLLSTNSRWKACYAGYFVGKIYYWDLWALNNAKPYLFLNEMNKKDLPAMYSTAFWCLFVVLLVFLALLRNHCYSKQRPSWLPLPGWYGCAHGTMVQKCSLLLVGNLTQTACKTGYEQVIRNTIDRN